jgi:hypothetical protein
MAWKRSFNRTTEISWRVHIYNVIDHQWKEKRKKRCISNDYDSRGITYLMIKSNHSCLCTLWMRH